MKRPALTAVVAALLQCLFTAPVLAQFHPEPGDLLWSQEIGGQLWAPLTYYEGTLYVGSSDALSLFAFDAGTGVSIWEFETDGWSWSAPVLADDVVYIGGLSASPYYFEGVTIRPGFHAVDRDAGAGLWEFTPPAVDGYLTGGVYSTPAFVVGVVYV
jgi:outer membrane protein assembly factor BamB